MVSQGSWTRTVHERSAHRHCHRGNGRRGLSVAASAVTGNNAFITDTCDGRAPRIDPKNQLATSVHDPASGTGAKVGADGRLLANATVGYPTTPIVTSGGLQGADDCGGGLGTCHKLIGPPAGKGLIVTSIHVNAFKMDGDGARALRRHLQQCERLVHSRHAHARRPGEPGRCR